MGFFEDVKNSLTGSSSSSKDFDNDKFDSSFTSGNQGKSGGNNELKPHEPGMQDKGGPAGPDQGQQTPAQNGLGGQGRSPETEQPVNDIGGPGSSSGSNPRAGSPQPGSSEPQVSEDTRREMENAGFDLDDSPNERKQPRGEQPKQGMGGKMDNSRGTVSSQNDDIQEIKSQNEQIIELLKRISDSLQHDSGNRDRGRGREGNRRHGGRR